MALRRKHALIAVATPVAIVGLYVFSICWRVGFAEQSYFGRSYLVPFSLRQRQYTDPATADSHGQQTYRFVRYGRQIVVYKQLINGFQHAYGSALAAFELGNLPSDLLFRANEYAEGYLEKDGASPSHYLDTKKDLFNNSVGRSIGLAAKQSHLIGQAADKFIVERILQAIDNKVVINHYLDARVRSLPSLEEYGCPGLPKPRIASL